MLILCYWYYILLLMLLRKSMQKSKHQYKNKNDDIMKTTNTFLVAAPHHRPRRPRRETSIPSSHYFFGWAFLATIFCRPPFFAAGEGLGEGDTAFLPFFCTGGVLWTDVFQERPLLAAGGGEAGATCLASTFHGRVRSDSSRVGQENTFLVLPDDVEQTEQDRQNGR